MTRLDGGLATLLQRQGLAQYSPVEPWLTDHPDRVRAAHQAFVSSGAQAVLTATFMAAASPDTLTDVVADAVTVASGLDVPVWGCSGPVAPSAGVYGELATALCNNGVTQLVLETFTRAEQAVDALRAALAAQPDLRVVVSVVPSGDQVLGCKTSLAHVYDALIAAGAHGVGANCAAPELVLEAQTHASRAPFWAKPSHCAEWVRRCRPLRDRCEWLGGCCGVSPTDLAALWAAP